MTARYIGDEPASVSPEHSPLFYPQEALPNSDLEKVSDMPLSRLPPPSTAVISCNSLNSILTPSPNFNTPASLVENCDSSARKVRKISLDKASVSYDCDPDSTCSPEPSPNRRKRVLPLDQDQAIDRMKQIIIRAQFPHAATSTVRRKADVMVEVLATASNLAGIERPQMGANGARISGQDHTAKARRLRQDPTGIQERDKKLANFVVLYTKSWQRMRLKYYHPPLNSIPEFEDKTKNDEPEIMKVSKKF